MYKVIYKESIEIVLNTQKELEEKMGIQWLHALEFQKASIEERIKRKSAKALKKGWLDTRQKWLGVYYSKEIKSGYHPDLLIKWLEPGIEYGVIANENLAKGTYIGEYTGVIRKRTRKDKNNFYSFEYAVGDGWESPYIIDAREKGNFTRFINHSQFPNLEPISVYFEDAMHVILIASKAIQKGEHLCYDYGADYWLKRTQPIIELS